MKKTTILKSILALSLAVVLIFGCVSVAGAATRIIGDVDGDGRVTINDATLIQLSLAQYPIEVDPRVGDTDGDGKLSINDATFIQLYLAQKPVEGSKIGETFEEEEYAYTYSLNGKLMEGATGVYEVKAKTGDRMDGDSPKTIGIPAIAKQNLTDHPTEDAPAIIMGAATGFETKTGAVEWTFNEGV